MCWCGIFFFFLNAINRKCEDSFPCPVLSCAITFILTCNEEGPQGHKLAVCIAVIFNMCPLFAKMCLKLLACILLYFFFILELCYRS